VIDGKTLVLWLPATVVSAINDSYEVIYDGNLPREDPFSTVHVPLQHVRPIKPSQPTPQPPPPSVAAGSSASATNTETAASKSLEMLPGAKPTTTGKSLRSVHDLALQKRPLPRPSIHRELELKPLAPKRPATKNHSAPPPPPQSSSSHATQDKVLKPRSRPVREAENPSSITSMARSSSVGSHPPPPKRPRHQAPPCASFASPSSSAIPPPPPSLSVSSSVAPASSSILGAAEHLKAARPSFAASAPQALPPPPTGYSSAQPTSAAAKSIVRHLKPGTRVAVRTRTLAKIDGKTLVLWLPAVVVSATDDNYEVIYDGNLPREDPFSTVRVLHKHVRPIRPPQPTPSPPPPSQPLSAAAAASKSSEMLLPAKPITAGKSLRPIRNSLSEMQPRPTTAGKSLHAVQKLKSETKQTPRPTTAGKSIHAYCLRY
jgi:hypothetical protein